MIPKPDPRALVPHPDDFDAWCEHPVTRFVATAMERRALRTRDAWIAASWGGGVCDPNYLIELRGRADALMTLLEAELSDYAKQFEET